LLTDRSSSDLVLYTTLSMISLTFCMIIGLPQLNKEQEEATVWSLWQLSSWRILSFQNY